MIKHLRAFGLLAGAFVVFAALPAVATAQTGAASGDAVASVNGASISRSDYYHRMEFLPDMGTLVGTQYVQVPPGLMTLDDLITEQLILQLAKKKGVSPTDSQVDDAMRKAMAANPMLEKDWVASGRTDEDLKANFRLQVARFNILTAGVIVTDTEVAKEYKDNPDRYTLPKRVHLRAIVLGSQDDEAAVDKALAAGTPFAEVAKQYSQDVTKDLGGDFGMVPLASLPQYVQDGLKSVKIGDTTGWITGTDGSRSLYMKALYVDAAAPQLLPLDDNLKSQIRRSLMMKRGATINDVSQELEDLRKSSTIVITNPTLASAYKSIVGKLKGDQKSGS